MKDCEWFYEIFELKGAFLFAVKQVKNLQISKTRLYFYPEQIDKAVKQLITYKKLGYIKDKFQW